jgi:uncharacterized membrane protein YfcA
VTPLEGLAVAGAGLVAGGMNAALGSGSLVSFPVLLAVGYPPVVANVSNGIGLLPGSVSGAFGYRRELAGQRARVLRLGAVTAVGAVGGAILLLVLPPDAFEAIVPVLILISVVLIVLQPWIARRIAHRRDRPAHGGPWLLLGVLAVGVYGGYFGAAQGVILLALMGSTLPEHLQRLNAVKNVTTGVAYLASGILFVFVAEVAWLVVALLAAGAVIGAQVGARYGRRLKPVWLRGLIVLVGLAAIVQLIVD